jgi:hypothetical protein
VVSMQPTAFTGAVETVAIEFSSPSGFAYLTVVNVLINNALDARQACYLAYSVADNTLFLVKDAGNAGDTTSMVLDGTPGALTNSQCSIDRQGSRASTTGNLLDLYLSISYTPAFAGNKVVYLAARDKANNTSGWQTAGVRTIPGAATPLPAPVSVSPASNSVASQLLTITYRDAVDATNLQTAWTLINTAIDGRQACYIAYYRPGNILYLLPDNGNPAQAQTMPLAGVGTLSNSQCTVSALGSTATVIGPTLTLTLNLTMMPGFAGRKGIWTGVQNLSGTATSSWQVLGEWQVPGN